jgi:hypothetical protein
VLATPRHGRDVKWLAERKYPISPHSHTVSPSQGEAPAEPPPFSPPLKHRQQLTVQTQPQRLGRSLALPKQPNTSSQQHIPLHSFVSIRGSKHHPIRVHSWFKTPPNSCPFVVQKHPSFVPIRVHSWFKTPLHSRSFVVNRRQVVLRLCCRKPAAVAVQFLLQERRIFTAFCPPPRWNSRQERITYGRSEIRG